MLVNAWSNGQHSQSGGGYGVKIKAADRDRYFEKEWKLVILELQGRHEPVIVRSVGTSAFLGFLQ